ncbi:MAG: hypothetical protein A3F84_18800 [Candidatus Handelsmanbacteria bacterium RIFCSPLOWO2_12_FULL_64_10]|uniref:HTH gntR-type domain-containing protein n=1 Tax=Handelsmanbacteria sp. (strain RIFCSPLOWO2_12_FULL_64_10) TaxID=1817868 RepID=A0A1F6D2A3_HANXR|nr:MAG: hypothetical protein A3F84_18800 [Candidatus Handelsmanbacteria bacterium RIFCSPLOWO2_12_FULL_64_10]
MNLKPLDRQTLREKVVEAIRSVIVENGLKLGDRLPTEHELAEQLSVGKSSVREALKSLELIGVIESRPKIGCVVKSADMSLLSEHISFSPQVSQVTVEELVEAREFLETNIVPLVIQRDEPEVFEEMAEGLKLMEEAVAGKGDRREADEKFHMALFKGAHNTVLQSFNEVMEGFFVRLREERVNRVSEGREWLDDHRAIYQAIENRDTGTAQALIRAHLRRYVN